MDIVGSRIGQYINSVFLYWGISGRYDQYRDTFFGLQDDCSFAFLHNLLEHEPFAKLDTTAQIRKSSATSQTFRIVGNNFFKNGQYQKAVDLYNDSLAAAPACAEDVSGKNTLALAFSNRSAALFYMEKYEECLKDIESALQNGYPQHMQHKLYARKGKCYLALRFHDFAKVAFQKAETVLENAKLDGVEKNALSTELQKSIAKCLVEPINTKGVEYSAKPAERTLPEVVDGPNATHPSLSSACNVTYTPNKGCKGCKVVANRDINPGEEILVEEPYATVLNKSFLSTHCYHCLKPYVAPTVCSQCTTVRYCSETCRDFSWDSYHKYECSFLEMIYELDQQIHLALRVILVSGLDCLLGHHQKDERKSAMSEELLGLNEDGQYLSNDYHTLHKRAGVPISKVDGDTMFRLAAIAECLTCCLEAVNFFAEVPAIQREQARNYVGYVLSKLLTERGTQILHFFLKGPIGMDETALGIRRDPIGVGLYVTFSLLNHSCDLVTARVFYGDQMVVRSTKTIRKGEEVLINFGIFFGQVNKLHRQAFLKEHFFFDCTCEACINDWIGYDDLNKDMKFVSPQFKCENCFKPLLPTMDTIHCSNCHSVQKPAQKNKMLMRSMKSYKVAFDKIQIGQFAEALPGILKHIAVMDRITIQPFHHYSHTQYLAQTCMQKLGS